MIPRHVSYQRLGARQRHLAHVAGSPGVHLGHRDGGVVPQQTGVDRLDSSLLWSCPSARLSYRLTSSWGWRRSSRPRIGRSSRDVVRQPAEESVRVVWLPVLADGVQSPGRWLDQEVPLLVVQDAGGQEDLVTVRLGVVLVRHVVHEPRAVPPGHGDETSTQQTGDLACRDWLGDFALLDHFIFWKLVQVLFYGKSNKKWNSTLKLYSIFSYLSSHLVEM